MTQLNTIKIFLLMTCLTFSTSSYANEVEVVNVKANQAKDKTWHFDVTLKHADAGWDHYANEWQVIGADNKILGTRTLYHPHVNEQPFTRSSSGVKIPEGTKSVRVIAKDTVHGLSHKAAEIDLANKEVNQITLDLKKAK
jgi:hypothetical protein